MRVGRTSERRVGGEARGVEARNRLGREAIVKSGVWW